MVAYGYFLELPIICGQTQLDGVAHEQTIICRSHGGLLTNEKKEKFASNDNLICPLS